VIASERHPVILRAEQVSKVFPGTTALDNVDFDVRRGAVDVLVGENGAGKSTLMKILAGVEQPSSGRVLMDGQPVVFTSIRAAARHGIGIVFQELNLCPNLTVAENLSLVDAPVRFGIDIDRNRQVKRARELLARLEHPIDPRTTVGDLRIGEQQIVEIAKALAADVRILIMDEPTSALSASEVEMLFRVIEDLKAHGVAIVYISHRLEEIVRIGDYITVLRDGRVQAEAEVKDVSVGWIIAEMVGPIDPVAQGGGGASGDVVLDVDGLTLPRASGGFVVDHVSMQIRKGEIVGIYGLMGAGRSELFECFMGLHRQAVGEVRLEGRPLGRIGVAERIARGLTLVPEDRQREGLIQSMSVRENLTLAALRKFAGLLTLDSGEERRQVERMIRSLTIKVSSPEIEVTALSGGNQQKVVIGKSLLTGPKVVLLDEPSRGIDVGAKAEVFRTMRELASAGLGVVFATSDLKEVMGVADRILVMSNGRVTGEFSRSEATEATIVAASTAALTADAGHLERLAS
jgi:erythritol transport system ATP-binding protein